MKFFSIYLILPADLGPGFNPASKKNEYQKQNEDFWAVERSRADNLTVICEPTA
jgi:hypothetical protein